MCQKLLRSYLVGDVLFEQKPKLLFGLVVIPLFASNGA